MRAPRTTSPGPCGLTSRWAERSKAAFAASPGRGLFGIVQGGSFDDLRAESADHLVRIGFDGYALGGFAVGEEKTVMLSVLEATAALLPAGAPRYLMGVGKPEDLVEAVARGIDMFDCVLPTRSGRTGQAFTREGALNLRNAVHASDPRPLDDSCACAVCRGYGRAYLGHLVRAGEILGSVLLTWHNLHYYQDLMTEMRGAIEVGGFQSFARDFAARRTEAGAARTASCARGPMTMAKLVDETLTQLGRAAKIPASPAEAVLESVPNPHPDTAYVVRFTCPEFTSICPLTGQPDFAHLVIDLRGRTPASSRASRSSCSWRPSATTAPFTEDCTVAIAKRLVDVLAPVWLRIGGYWYPRGRDAHRRLLPERTGAPTAFGFPDQGVPPYRGRG